MSSKENPYASPQAEVRSGPGSHPYSWLHAVGLAILVLGWIDLACALAAFFVRIDELPIVGMLHPVILRIPIWILYFGWWATSIALLCRSIVMIIGATQIRSRNSYRWSIAAAITAMFGVIYPLFWLDGLFGLWALAILLRQDTRAAFAQAK